MLSIIMPTYNRGHFLKESYGVIDQALVEAGYEYELIVVDDGSKDDTAELLKIECGKKPNLKGIVLKKNSGQQNATLAGIRMAKYPYIVTIDDDLTYDPKGICQLYGEIQNGYDVVYGVIDQPHENRLRKLGTRGKELVFFLFLKKPFDLRLTSFRIMKGDIVSHISNDQSHKVYISASALQYSRNMKSIRIGQLTIGRSTQYTVGKLVGLMVTILMNYTSLSKFRPRKQGVNQYEIKEIYR